MLDLILWEAKEYLLIPYSLHSLLCLDDFDLCPVQRELSTLVNPSEQNSIQVEKKLKTYQNWSTFYSQVLFYDFLGMQSQNLASLRLILLIHGVMVILYTYIRDCPYFYCLPM